MPKIFDKDCKLRVIEYGVAESGAEFIQDIKTAISDCIAKITG